MKLSRKNTALRAAPPVENLKGVLTKLAVEVAKVTPPGTTDVDLKEDIKRAAARHAIPFDGRLVNEVLDTLARVRRREAG